MLSGNFGEMTTSMQSRDLVHAANLQHRTDKGRRAEDFFALKNLTASAG